jgi:hypothetical protein
MLQEQEVTHWSASAEVDEVEALNCSDAVAVEKLYFT